MDPSIRYSDAYGNILGSAAIGGLSQANLKTLPSIPELVGQIGAELAEMEAALRSTLIHLRGSRPESVGGADISNPTPPSLVDRLRGAATLSRELKIMTHELNSLISD